MISNWSLGIRVKRDGMMVINDWLLKIMVIIGHWRLTISDWLLGIIMINDWSLGTIMITNWLLRTMVISDWSLPGNIGYMCLDIGKNVIW